MTPKLPKLPRAKYNGMLGDIQARNTERARIMSEFFGVRFSNAMGNPLGVKHAKALGLPGAGLPRAIYVEREAEPMGDPETIKTIEQAYNRWAAPGDAEGKGYVSFTTLYCATGIDFKTIFGVVKYLRTQDPYSVRLSVDRAGRCTIVRFLGF